MEIHFFKMKYVSYISVKGCTGINLALKIIDEML